MRFRNNDEFVNDSSSKEIRWCFKNNITAYPMPQQETYRASSGRRKHYVKIEINCDGKLLVGKQEYKQEQELTKALQKVYSHYYARRFGNKLM
jgi:biopolymer transport protein ExbD